MPSFERMTVTERVAGVLRLNASAFEEIEADHRANGQAFAIVVLTTLAAGVAGGQYGGLGRMTLEALGAVVGWITWAAVTYVLGVRLLPERETRSDIGELLRVMGYSTAPSFFSILGALPIVGRFIPDLISFWLLGTTVIGVRQALDYKSTLRAFVVVIVGWLFFVWIRDFGIPWLWNL
jgi:hypothetical protein